MLTGDTLSELGALGVLAVKNASIGANDPAMEASVINPRDGLPCGFFRLFAAENPSLTFLRKFKKVGNADTRIAIEVGMKRFTSTPVHHTGDLNPGGSTRQFNGLGWSEVDSLFEQMVRTLDEADRAAASRAKNGAGGLRPRRRQGSFATRMVNSCEVATDQPGGWSRRFTLFQRRSTK